MIETKHVIGVPGRCIPEQAVELNADYIVLGSHGHGAFYDLVIGGTASRVLKEAHCPVVVVPHATLTKKAPRIRPRPSARARLSVVR